MFYNLLIISVGVSLAVILLRLTAPLTDKKYSVLWRYRLLLLLSLRLLIPFRIDIIHIPTPAFPQQVIHTAAVKTPSPTTLSRPNNNDVQPPESDTVSSPPEKPQYIRSLTNTHTIIVACWLIGAILSFSLHLTRYINFTHTVSKTETYIMQHDLLPIYSSSSVSSPLLIGYIKPRIILPEKCLGSPGIQLIIAHESEHFRRKDLWAKLLLCLAVSIHWFNPVIHYMVRFATRDMEYSCDDAVLSNQDEAYRKFYAKTILENINNERKL